jgi:hypothetical protein
MHQGRASLKVAAFRIRALFEKLPQRLNSPVPGRRHQGSLLLRGLGAPHIGAPADQFQGAWLAAGRKGGRQGGNVADIPTVRIPSGIEKNAEALDIAGVGGGMDSGPAVDVAMVWSHPKESIRATRPPLPLTAACISN